ncbi:hypothetical protein Lal_00006392 [Lupinus albus]|uniref:Uncharacterized protein n=1 Tax=Lupinus albus TaxID=3870 RepID=A0A6A4Q7H9_LUPAL|nr:hypothetical protein Lalb_Chr07g0177581 [Lupinus albus]KAF1875762.1 hypothetical protein Lal_00006392 [Lupinus albus]
MGCGKSKHDVASDNTLQRKKSSKTGQKNWTETKDNNVDNVVSSEVEQNNNENVKETGVGGKADESNNEKDKCFDVKEDKALEEKSKGAEETTQKRENVDVKEPISDKDDPSLKENDAPAIALEEEKKGENQKDEVETKGTVQEETLTKEEETKDTIVPTAEGEEKH